MNAKTFHPGDLVTLGDSDILVTVMELSGDVEDGSTLVSENESAADAFYYPTDELLAEGEASGRLPALDDDEVAEGKLMASDYAGWSRI